MQEGEGDSPALQPPEEHMPSFLLVVLRLLCSGSALLGFIRSSVLFPLLILGYVSTGHIGR